MTEEKYLAPADTGRVSIVIKALNEEKRIARAIESSLKALERLGGEVILADSCSTDKTIEIAKRYPIKIVQLANPAERCCGIGPQLGYQHSKGEYVYILDGDMELRPDFIDQAVQFLDDHPKVAGVGGRVVEHNLDSMEYKARVERNAHHMGAGPVDRLDMGGLYRRAAIEDVGYFSDRNLHSYEELDLAVRLRASGMQLHRIGVDSVDHHGHDAPPYQLLFRRWKTKYIYGIGEILRASVWRPHFGILIRQLRELKLYIYVISLFILSFAFAIMVVLSVKNGWIYGGAILMLSLLSIVVLIAIRKKSINKSMYSIISLMMHCVALVIGVFVIRKNPTRIIDSIVFKK